MKLTPEDSNKVQELIKSGLTLRQVAEVFGVSYETIRTHYGKPLYPLRRIETLERKANKRQAWLDQKAFDCLRCGKVVYKKDRLWGQCYCVPCFYAQKREQRNYHMLVNCRICGISFHPHRRSRPNSICSRPCQIKFIIANNKTRHRRPHERVRVEATAIVP